MLCPPFKSSKPFEHEFACQSRRCHVHADLLSNSFQLLSTEHFKFMLRAPPQERKGWWAGLAEIDCWLFVFFPHRCMGRADIRCRALSKGHLANRAYLVLGFPPVTRPRVLALFLLDFITSAFSVFCFLLHSAP